MAKQQPGSIYKKTPEAKRWTGAYVDPFDGRRRVATLFTDFRASRKRLDEMILVAERRATGLIDSFAEQRQRHIREHVREYLAHCEHIGESAVHRGNKKTQFDRFLDGIQAQRLTDLEPNRVERYLAELGKSGRTTIRKGQDAGLSARTVNQHRASIVAFMEWCVQTGRFPENVLKIVPKLDERKDRRRIRRAFTVEELGRLFEIAGRRRSLYVIAVYTGLRRGELGKLRWGDIDREGGVVRVRVGVGKAAREDFIPLHPAAAAEFEGLRGEGVSDAAPVFRTLPTAKTVRDDLKRAGIPQFDSEGRAVDFHAFRTTTGTMLARSGIVPQLAAKVMRHSDVKITMKHYTDLRLHDVARAVESLPEIGRPGEMVQPMPVQATGTGPLAQLASEPERSGAVAPVEAHGAPKGASGDSSVQLAQNPSDTLRFPDRGGKTAQTRYTSALGSGVHPHAGVVGAGHRKAAPAGKTRAIGAVG